MNYLALALLLLVLGIPGIIALALIKINHKLGMIIKVLEMQQHEHRTAFFTEGCPFPEHSNLQQICTKSFQVESILRDILRLKEGGV